MKVKILSLLFFVLGLVLMGASCDRQNTTRPIIPVPALAPQTQSVTTDSSEPVPVSNQPEFTVQMKRFTFEPNVLNVKKGDLVTIHAQSIDVSHGLSIPEFKVNAIAPVGETVNVTFLADKVGTFSFRCSVYCGEGHQQMTGTLIVNE